jgi:hypothetical protein
MRKDEQRIPRALPCRCRASARVPASSWRCAALRAARMRRFGRSALWQSQHRSPPLRARRWARTLAAHVAAAALHLGAPRRRRGARRQGACAALCAHTFRVRSRYSAHTASAACAGGAGGARGAARCGGQRADDVSDGAADDGAAHRGPGHGPDAQRGRCCRRARDAARAHAAWRVLQVRRRSSAARALARTARVFVCGAGAAPPARRLRSRSRRACCPLRCHADAAAVAVPAARVAPPAAPCSVATWWRFRVRWLRARCSCAASWRSRATRWCPTHLETRPSRAHGFRSRRCALRTKRTRSALGLLSVF